MRAGSVWPVRAGSDWSRRAGSDWSRRASGGSRGGSGVSTEPPFLAGYVINLICTVKDPGFMEPPFLPFG